MDFIFTQYYLRNKILPILEKDGQINSFYLSEILLAVGVANSKNKIRSIIKNGSLYIVDLNSDDKALLVNIEKRA